MERRRPLAYLALALFIGGVTVCAVRERMATWLVVLLVLADLAAVTFLVVLARWKR